jgi:allophanate hydrolase
MVLPPGIPPEPGVRPDRNGTSIGGERWLLSPSGFARFTEGLPAPVSLGPVELVSGETVTGVRCDAGEARDITEFGDWRGYLRYVSVFRSAAGFLAGPASG